MKESRNKIRQEIATAFNERIKQLEEENRLLSVRYAQALMAKEAAELETASLRTENADLCRYMGVPRETVKSMAELNDSLGAVLAIGRCLKL